MTNAHRDLATPELWNRSLERSRRRRELLPKARRQNRRRLAEVRATVHEDPLTPALSTRIEVRSRRLRGSAGRTAPVIADLRHAGRCPAAENAHLHARPAFLNSRKKLAVVASASASGVLAAQLGNERRGVGDERRLARLPAVRDRREERGIGLDQHPVGGQPFGGLLKFRGVLERDDPATARRRSRGPAPCAPARPSR